MQSDSSVATLKTTAVAIPAPLKPTPNAVNVAIVPEQIVFVDSVPYQDTLIAETPVVSLFTGHELKPVNKNPIEKINLYSGWITVFLLGSVLVVAYLRAAYPKRFIEFFRAVLDIRFAQQLVREEKVLSQRVSVFLTVVFFSSASTFLYFVYGFFHLQIFAGEGLLLFGKIALTILLLFLLRIFIIELSGFVFNAQNEFSFYNFHIFLFNKALGLALIPVLAGLVYVAAFPKEAFIYTGIFLFFISYLARLIRGLIIGMSKQGYNKFYLFFYFCTLEILPVVVLAKIILQHTA